MQISFRRTNQSSASLTFGQPWMQIATPLLKSAYLAKIMATSSTKSKNNSTPYSPHGPSQYGEWTSSALFPQAKAK